MNTRGALPYVALLLFIAFMAVVMLFRAPAPQNIPSGLFSNDVHQREQPPAFEKRRFPATQGARVREQIEPGWAIKYQEEFWRARTPRQAANRLTAGTLSLNDAIDRVSHAFRTNDESGAWKVSGARYSSRLREFGWSFVPHEHSPPAAAAGADTDLRNRRGALGPVANCELSLWTARVRSGPDVIYERVGSGAEQWHVKGNTAQFQLDGTLGLVEHLEATTEGVSWTWIIQKPMPRQHPLTVQLKTDGLDYAGASANGYHFADASGVSRVRIGHAMLVDSAGHRWELPTRREDSGVAITVAPDVLAGATYPVAIDPVVSAEFGFDNPVMAGAYGFQSAPAIACRDGQCLVVWTDSRARGDDVYGIRLSADGTFLDAQSFPICTAPESQERPGVAAATNGYLVVWQDSRSNSASGVNIYGARVDRNGAVLEPAGTPICTAPGLQLEPVVASSGSNYMVLWADARDGASSGFDVYCARVSDTGIVLDSGGVLLQGGANDQRSPAIDFNGTEFLAVWSDARNIDADVFGNWITPDGSLSHSNGFAVVSHAGSQSQPAVSCQDDLALVAFSDLRAGGFYGDIYGARVSRTSGALDMAGFPIVIAPDIQSAPSIAPTPTGFLVVWDDWRDQFLCIYGAEVAGNGVVTPVSGALLEAAPDSQFYQPAIAKSGNDYLLIWEGGLFYGGDQGVLGRRVTASGSPVETNRIVVSRGFNGQDSPVVAFNGTDYLAVWMDTRNSYLRTDGVWGARVSPAGIIRDPDGIEIKRSSRDIYAPAVSSDGDGFFVVWSDDPGDPGNVSIHGARISNDGLLLAPADFEVSRSPGNAEYPAVAFGSGQYLVAWGDDRQFNTHSLDIYATRMSPGGTRLDAADLPIAVVADTDQWSPAVTASSNRFLIVWWDQRDWRATGEDIYGTIVTDAGMILQTNGFPICSASNSQWSPDAAGNGNGFLVAWEDQRTWAASGYDIYGARVSLAGEVSDTNGIPICTASGNQYYPRVAAYGTNYVVVWEDYRNGSDGDVFGARVSASGALLEPNGFGLNTNVAYNGYSDVVFGGAGQVLVVSEGFRQGAVRAIGNFLYPDLTWFFIQGISVDGGTVTLRWSAEAQRTYRVAYSDSSPLGPWNLLPGDIVADGDIATKTDAFASNIGARFYRVLLLP